MGATIHDSLVETTVSRDVLGAEDECSWNRCLLKGIPSL
jgi:hypothetical protein